MADRLGYRTEMHVSIAASQPYREATGLDDIEALRELRRVLGRAMPLALGTDPEAWIAEDEGRGLRVVARVVRWRAHVFVVTVSVRPLAAPTIGGADITRAVLERYVAARQLEAAMAEEELRALLWDAVPVELDARPESWQVRSGIGRIPLSLLVQRAGADGSAPPIVIDVSVRR